MSNEIQAAWGAIMFVLLGASSFVLAVDMPEWINRILRHLSLRAALGTIATALLVRGVTVIPDNPLLAEYMCGTGTLLGGLVMAMVIVSQQHFLAVRDTLGLFLTQADELMARSVTTQESYSEWVHDLNLWFRTVTNFLEQKLSATHAALFRDLSQGGRYGTRGYNAEHMDYKNSLLKYMANLRRITDQYIATRN